MNIAPADPRLYHLTHVDNLASIVAQGGLWSDAAMVARGGPDFPIGMSTIKQRRLQLPVKCHPGTYVGGYVPFYLCPRSVMLYLLHRGNHPDVTYSGGQGPLLHLEADLREAAAWADAEAVPWAFTLSNAGAAYTEFRARLDQLDEVNWQAVDATDFREASVKEGKQAEFLVRDYFPWFLVRRIGVQSAVIQNKVARILSGAAHQTVVEVRPEWYY